MLQAVWHWHTHTSGFPQVNWMFQQPATLELTHNWGTEADPDAKMHNGNDKPQGYGHIG